MKSKTIATVLAGGLLTLAAGLVHVPAQSDAIPEKYRDTVAKGLEYLAKNQLADGHWEGEGGQHPVAMTGLVGLALLMEREGPRARGFSPRRGKYLNQIEKAVDWLLDKSQRDGLIFSGHASETSRYMEGHGLATLFLAGVERGDSLRERREKLEAALGRAVKAIVKAQSTAGGWHHTSKVEGHDFDNVMTTVIQLQALYAMENTAIEVPHAAIADAQEFLATSLRKNVATSAGPQRHAEMAGALACRISMTEYLDSKEMLIPKWTQVCRIPASKEIQFGRDELMHYYYALAEIHTENWSVYRTAVFDQLRSRQSKDGSWPAAEGLGAGPVYATALWCTILQLDNESHPVRSMKTHEIE